MSVRLTAREKRRIKELERVNAALEWLLNDVAYRVGLTVDDRARIRHQYNDVIDGNNVALAQAKHETQGG